MGIDDAILIGFQFHKGTIKTVGANIHLIAQHHFNSIKVRLKQGAKSKD